MHGIVLPIHHFRGELDRDCNLIFVEGPNFASTQKISWQRFHAFDPAYVVVSVATKPCCKSLGAQPNLVASR